MVSVTPRPLFTPGKAPIPLVQEAGLALGPVWTCAQSLAPPPGFDPRTVQPIASRYTDNAIRPTQVKCDKFCSYDSDVTYPTILRHKLRSRGKVVELHPKVIDFV